MPLFEQSTAPIGQRGKRYSESTYAYYQDSERPGIIAICNLLEEWFQQIPEDERQDLQQRLGPQLNDITGPRSSSCFSITSYSDAGFRSSSILMFRKLQRIRIL